MRRTDLLQPLGLTPTIGTRLRAVLEAALAEAEARTPGAVAVLDAGCGHVSPLRRLRPRIALLVGVDIHEPAEPMSWLDAFAVVDLCVAHPSPPVAPAGFDLILSNFTLEHFADPDAALSNMHAWLRPGGHLVVTTVNRRHPFVDAYLRLPDPARRRLQPLLKASAADAHPLVGACNTPRAVRDALRAAGFVDIRVEPVPNLARAWGRRRWTFAIGLAGDLLTGTMPWRRSTLLASGRVPVPVPVAAPG
jgi:SAM-dependent methyltransferase